MSGANRKFKLKHYKDNPNCFYCNRRMILDDVPQTQLSEPPDPLTCTVEHLRSRYELERFVNPNGEQRKVLACYECNSERANKETLSLPREELLKRGKGFSFNPRGNPIFRRAVNSLEEVITALKERWPDWNP